MLVIPLDIQYGFVLGFYHGVELVRHHPGFLASFTLFPQLVISRSLNCLFHISFIKYAEKDNAQHELSAVLF